MQSANMATNPRSSISAASGSRNPSFSELSFPLVVE